MKTNTLKRVIGSLKRTEGEHERDATNSESFPSQPSQKLESKEPRAETMLISTENQIKNTQQIFDEKRCRREQRRSLRESGDFLGVQGANPRTGYWDLSDATSSSEPSQMSENTRHKLEQQARDLFEKKKQYEEAQKLQQEGLKRYQKLKELRKKATAEQKKVELIMRQKRHGKWRASENGWSSVAEPELSPIQQSVAGTPVAGELFLVATIPQLNLLTELAPGDRLFPMPCAADPNPYLNGASINQGDYFGHRSVSSPLAQRRQRNSGQGTFFLSSIMPRKTSIPRKPVGSTCRQHNESSETVVHLPPILVRQSSKDKLQQTVEHCHDHPSPVSVQKSSNNVQQAVKHCHGPTLLPFLDFPERKATVISFRSVSMKPVVIHPQWTRSLRIHRVISLDELPPVLLKDPIAVRIQLRIPLSYQPQKKLLRAWAPPTIVKTEPDKRLSFINTSTITTTGRVPLLLLPKQLDEASDSRKDTQSKQRCLQYNINQIPQRMSTQRNKPRGTQKTGFQIHAASTVISSEHQLSLTKELSIKLCQISSPGGNKADLKSKFISTSTCLQSPEKQKNAAQNAALLAFQQSRRETAMKKTEGQDGGLLTPPKIRRQKREGAKKEREETKGVRRLAQDVNVGTGDPSDDKRGQGLFWSVSLLFLFLAWYIELSG